MSVPTPNGKRLRTERTPSSPSIQSRGMNLQRWVWLKITVANARSTSQTNRYYVPEDVIRYIPKYKAKLDEELAAINRDPQVVAKAVRFLTSGYLYPLDASSNTTKDTLDDLVKLYSFSTSLSIKRLEVGILSHIKNFDAGCQVPEDARRLNTPAVDNLVIIEGISLPSTIKCYHDAQPLCLTLPESIAREILDFRDKLDAAVPGPDGSRLISVRLVLPDRRILKAISFLLSSFLAPITGTADETSTNLNELVKLYEFSLTMSIPKLEDAVIHHLDRFSEFTIKRFIDLASPYFDSEEDAHTTSLGCYFESHLEENLQSAAELDDATYKLKLKTGDLGKVYTDLLEDGSKKRWKRDAKKSRRARARDVEVDENDVVKVEAEDEDFE